MVSNPMRKSAVTVGIQGDSSGLSNAVSAALSKLGSLKGAALTAGTALGALGAGGFLAATKAAADFEEQMVEVEKVTNPETAAEMSDRIREMSTEMPVAQEELAGIAAQAGRFGVEGPENIEKFTESVSKMSVATDLSTEQAGQAFARMTTLMDEEISNVENVGSAVNELSNTMATSASEITNASTRSAGALNQLGLESNQILSLNAAMNEVSASSRIAGTRLRRFAQEIQDPKKTEDMAAALGMSVEEFERMREESPNELMQLMVERFQAGGESADALRETLSTTSRQALAGLAENTESWTEAQEASAEQLEEGTSLQEEYDAAADTFHSKLAKLVNQVRELAIQVGNRLLPPLTDLLEATTDLAGRIGRDLGPIMDDLATFVREDLAPVLTDLGQKARATVTELIDAWESVDHIVMPILRGLTELIAVNLETGLNGMLESMQLIANLIQGDFGEAWENLKSMLSTGLEGALDILGIVKDGITATVGWLGRKGADLLVGGFEFLTGTGEDDGLPGLLLDGIQAGFDAIVEWIASVDVIDWVADLADRVKESITEAIREAVDIGPGRVMSEDELEESTSGVAERSQGTALNQAPGVATGGLIERSGLANLHAGERVIPAAQVTDRGEAEASGPLDLRVEIDAPGDGPIQEYVRENAEVVVERDNRQTNRANRRLGNRGSRP